MIISPDILRRDVIKLNTRIDKQIEAIEEKAREFHVEPEELRDTDGQWVLVPLLTSKARLMASLVELNKRPNPRER